ncbi:MAG: hypothetical protein J6X22_08145 [Muribaculaceae bacterium]|nr:hypothetical protein [Muribaculaceae bacterium]
MKNLLKSLLVIAICAMPMLAMAQPESCKVKVAGSKATIKDFAKAYCSQCDEGSFEREALAAIIKGSKKTVVDIKNGFMKYSTKQGGITETLEMCFWNCKNKNEKLIAVNRVSEGGGLDESFLEFYRYNVKTKVMKHIEPPFDDEPQPIDMVDLSVAGDDEINQVKSARNEDMNKYMPIFKLPRYGKNITMRMADRNAIHPALQRETSLIWNGSTFSVDR